MIDNEILGCYERHLDNKRRLIIPKEACVEAFDGDKLVVIMRDDFVELKSCHLVLEELREIRERIKTVCDRNLLVDLENNYEQLCLSINSKLEVKQGRVLLSKEVVDKYSFDSDNGVVVVGFDNCFRIYSADVYNRKRNKNR